MAARLEIGLRDGLMDAEGANIKRKATDYFGFEIEDIRVIRVLTIDADLDEHQLEMLRTHIFTNPVMEDSSFSPMAKGADWLIWIGFRPGVRDTGGSTAQEAIEDLLKLKFKPDEAVYTSKLYLIKGRLLQPQAETIARNILANDIIQQWKVYSIDEWDPEEGIGLIIPKVVLDHEPQVSTIAIGSDEELKGLSLERNLALQESDIPVIRQYFLREDIQAERKKHGLRLPTDVELEYISQARSDHCNHNTFKGLFRYHDLSSGHKEIVDNKKKIGWFRYCGIMRESLASMISTITRSLVRRIIALQIWRRTAALLQESSVFTMGTGMGSKLIMGLYGYCVGPRDYAENLSPHLHPRRLLDGVIEGVKDGGNKSGIPTPFGQVLFDESYLGKCLVFVTALGIMPAKVDNESSHLKTTTPGDLIIMSGGRVGKDGIHGVTAASETYSESTPAGHVQIGDPYTQKKMHDFLLEARDEGLISFITDNGGGGLSSSVGESARFSNGCRVDLDKVPLKYDGLDQWEIWVSESQERMTIAVKPEHLDRFMELSERHAVESTVIGEYNDSGYLRLDYKENTCAFIRVDFLTSDFPQWEFDAEWIPPEMRALKEPVLSEPRKYGSLLKNMLSRPNIASRNWIARQYDHEVQGGSVIKPLVGKRRDMVSDAAVIRPVLHLDRGIGIAQALNPSYSQIDTYHMSAATIDEAVRRVLAIGGDPNHLGGVDNFCWPTIQYDPVQNPDGKYKAAQLVRANWALRNYCLAYGIPLLSGKDSMYIDGNLEGPFGERRKVSGLPTLLFTVSSVIEDVGRCVTMDAKIPGDPVYVLGETKNELGGGEYYQMMGEVGLRVPEVDANKLWPLYVSLHKAIQQGLVSSAHAVTRGGLGVHLAMVAMGGELGMEIHLGDIPSSGQLTASQILFSESAGRFVVTIDPAKQKAFEKIFDGLIISQVGIVAESPVLRIKDGEGALIIEEEISQLKDWWNRPFGGLI
jgi:phosphoribosylformylglycinamidine synthase